MKLIILLVGMLMCSSSAYSEDKKKHIYLMAKAKVKNTTLTSVAFLTDKSIDSIEQCEKEKRYGYQGRWRYLRHPIKRMAGMSLQMTYFCLKTRGKFSRWNQYEGYRHVFLIHYENNEISLTESRNYAACMSKMRKFQQRESDKLFCARVNQEYLP